MTSTLAISTVTDLRIRDERRAAAAHLLRRTSLVVDPGRVDALADLDHDDAVAEVLDHHGPDGPETESAPSSEDAADTISWWLDHMGHPDTGLTDRMAWFWHNLLTSSRHKASNHRLVADQLDHFRQAGRGDFRSLLHGYVTSGALLDYLDGSGSTAARPNENLSRELMELFTIGRGNYSEDDVRAAARALAGWAVEDGEVVFRSRDAFIAPLVFLGDQAAWDTTMIVDRLCDHPATAVRVAGRLWTDLVGTAPTADAAIDLGSWWQQRDLAIEPLIERILGDEAFIQGRLSRPRTGVEWFCAARAAAGANQQPIDGDLWVLERLGQLPYDPPNVGGWPRDDRWLSAGSLLARGALAQDLAADELASDRLGASMASTDAILDGCAIHEVSEATWSAIDAVGSAGADEGVDPASVQLVRWRLALTSPEFNLS